MRLFYCDHFVLPLPPGHRFPMAKYGLLRDRVVEAGLGGNGRLQVPEAGADPFEGDRLGRLGVTKAGLEARDRLVLTACRERGFPWPWS